MSENQPEPATEEEAFPQGRRCYVGNLAWRTSWQDLKDHFKPCGIVVYANVMQDGQGAFNKTATT
jgi:RNA recognition motif-containing protein